MAVYSPDRVSRLRLVLLVVVLLGAVLMLFAAFILFDDPTDPGGIYASTVACLLLISSGVTFLLLERAHPRAKIASVATSALCLLCGVGLAGTWLAFLLPLVGLGLLFLSLLPDEPEAGA